jgi:hypothetical protein
MGVIVSIGHNPLINIKEDTTPIIHSIPIYKQCAFCSHEFGQPQIKITHTHIEIDKK